MSVVLNIVSGHGGVTHSKQSEINIRKVRNKKLSHFTKDHIYRMVIVEGRCTMARSSSFRSKLFLG